ncbi:MAG TPA: 3-hydroxyacyl-CoA dehydrogenase/enoyl-CoA hydratase family protein [Actinomycetes bacterium]|nr:3-hydroxyacyl-CoA dehydrogenase/enoyl-CoA hydratase family protein [Actinomycetes bacterium]
MPDQTRIRRVAVLGAGTMGAAIAAHAANAGLAVDLLDVPGEGSDRDATVRAGFERMLTARPAALMSPALAARIRLGNFDDDFDRLTRADWVVEAVVERVEPKQQLLERVEKALGPATVVSTNTSGLPLARIAEGRSPDFRRRFVGTHFFNPPRYLKLVELIVPPEADPAVAAGMQAFLEQVLGKGVVRAQDTPNFIANRLGVLAGMSTVRYAFEHGFTVEEVDALTGPLIGWPRTATFRLFDQVGLDVMVAVAENLHRLVPDDDARESLRAPEPLRRMLDAGLLGIKTGAGFYKRTRRDGRTAFDVLDPDTLSYRPAREPDLPLVEAADAERDLGARLRLIMERAEDDRGARFLRDTLLPALAYASRRVPEISGSLVDVDHAMEWGFGQRLGTFRLWDQLGVRATAERMRALGLEVGGWVQELLDRGGERFYVPGDGGEQVVSPVSGGLEPVPVDPEVLDLGRVRDERGVVAANGSASLVDLGDGVLCLELHGPSASVDGAVLELGLELLDELAGGRWKALVIASRTPDFSVGANLFEIGMLGAQVAHGGADPDQLAQVVRSLHRIVQGLRFAPVPVVAAPHGRTLGAGAELCLAADRIVAAGETYLGLPEVGVGVVPAGGGCKELLRRVVSPAMAAAGDAPPLPWVRRVFETIGTAKVAAGAVEARELGFLDADDRIVLHPDHLLAAAKRTALALADGYRPPDPATSRVFAAGAPTLAALELGVQTLQWAGRASGHDGVIGRALARVLCGGELSAPQWVSEQHILDLELEAFSALAVQQPTLDRIQHMLTTRTPLRN